MLKLIGEVEIRRFFYLSSSVGIPVLGFELVTWREGIKTISPAEPKILRNLCCQTKQQPSGHCPKPKHSQVLPAYYIWPAFLSLSPDISIEHRTIYVYLVKTPSQYVYDHKCIIGPVLAKIVVARRPLSPLFC